MHRIRNPKGGVGVQSSNFRGISQRLADILSGLSAEILAKRTEAYIKSFYREQLVQTAKQQFYEVSQSAPQRATASLLMRARGGNGAAQLERSRFLGSMSIAVNYPKEYLLASPLARFLVDRLNDGADFIGRNGSILFSDFRSPVIKSKAFVRKFWRYTDFELWMKGSGRYLQSLMTYLGRVTEPTETDFNLLHLLIGRMDHSIENIRESKLLSLNLRIVLLDRETARLRRLQMAMKDLGALSLITKLMGKCNQHASEDFVWSYVPLTLSLANAMISWRNTECQEFIIDSIEAGIAKQKPPEMNSLIWTAIYDQKVYACALLHGFERVAAG